MMLVADNLQILRPEVQEAMARKDPEPIARLIRQMEEAGAEAVDLNAGPCRRNPEREMAFLVQSAEAATRLPLFIDTANPRAMAAGVRAAGLSMALLNVFHTETMNAARACRALASERVFSWAELGSMAAVKSTI